jgi:Fe-S-cluster-containing hydrogenase component 2
VLHDAPACTGCAKCEAVCPFDAIEMAPHSAAVNRR